MSISEEALVTLVLTALLALCLVAGAGVVAVMLVNFGNKGDVPRGRPTWLGPDATEVERELREIVVGRREDAPRTDHPPIVELARYHAHDMSVRQFSGEVDPEGADLAARRARLHPDLRGESQQWQTLQLLEPGLSAEVIAHGLLPVDPDLDTLLREARWTDVGVGVAIEEGRCAACIVVAEVVEPPARD